MRVPTRDELANVFKDPRLVVAVESLFKQVSTATTNDELAVSIGNVSSNANLALALLAQANHKLDLIALAPEKEFVEDEALNNSVLTWISVV